MTAQALTPQQAAQRPQARQSTRAPQVALILVAVAAALWSVMGFVGDMTASLQRTAALNEELTVQLTTLQTDLVAVRDQTVNIATLNDLAIQAGDNIQQVAARSEEISSDTEVMIASLTELNTKVEPLQGELETAFIQTNDLVPVMSRINGKSEDLISALSIMKNDVITIDQQSKTLPPYLDSTSKRLSHIVSITCLIGDQGIAADLDIRMQILGINGGSAKVAATLIPQKGWVCR